MSGEEIAGRYRLIEPLGHGAMSSVWLAEDTELERRVAVKLLSPAADRARFEREARSAAALQHPNLCALYDYGESAGKPFMVLEYLPNGSLEERLRSGGPLDDAETTRIATEIAAGLAHAHGRGVVHRDLKPANVLFDSEGRAKIADFGIARMGNAGTLTEAGTVLGTASYISPEQAGGLPAAPASDVYSFGVILFRMLTGRLPFVGTNAMEVVRMHRDDPPPTVAEFRPDAPVRLERLATAALQKDPAARPRDGAALLDALRGTDTGATIVTAAPPLATGADAAATQVISPRPARPAATRRRTAVAASALIVLALLGAGVAVALLLTGGSSGGDGATLPSLSLPSVSTVPGSTSAPTTTTAETSTAATTAPTTTAAPATTQPTTTAQTSTAPATVPTLPTVPATTVVPPTTTIAPPATTAPVTTDTTTATTPTTPATTTVAPVSPGPTTTGP
jgi:eukaryotic-like serine/threonine-protein kinase